MIPNNNFSVLPWYNSVEEQNAKKWWVYGRVYPLYTPAGFLPPFQIMLPNDYGGLLTFSVYDANTGQRLDQYGIPNLVFGQKGGFVLEKNGYVYICYPAIIPMFDAMENGRYYLRCDTDEYILYSDVFTVVNDIQPYLKLSWWDEADFDMDAGAIIYQRSFKNFVYLDSNIAKPEYTFEEEGTERDGYFFPTKQISEKHYRFNFLSPEYLLDVLRFVRMSDHIQIEANGKTYSVDSFLITPEWESQGDIATVQAEFDTATVAKKIGVGYIRSQRGDFNDDFNNDFNN